MSQQPAQLATASTLALLTLATAALWACADDEATGGLCADPAEATWSIARDPLTGQAFHWPDAACVSVAVAESGAKAGSAASLLVPVEAATAMWGAVDCAPICVRVAGTAIDDSFGYTPDAETQQTLLLWVSSEDDWRSRHSEAALAITSIVTRPVSGEIIDADIELNDWGAFSWSLESGTAGVDLQSVVAHELGHVFGLGHDANPTALMWGEWSPGWQPRALAASDLAAICTLYACPERLR